VSLPLEQLQCPGFYFWLTLVEALRPILARESDLIIDRRSLECGGAPADDLSCQCRKNLIEMNWPSAALCKTQSLRAFSSDGVRYCRSTAASLLERLPWIRCQKEDAGKLYDSAHAAYVLFSVEFLQAAKAFSGRSPIVAMHFAYRRKHRLVRLQETGVGTHRHLFFPCHSLDAKFKSIRGCILRLN
jgi:hypothetical protein